MSAVFCRNYVSVHIPCHANTGNLRFEIIDKPEKGMLY